MVVSEIALSMYCVETLALAPLDGTNLLSLFKSSEYL